MKRNKEKIIITALVALVVIIAVVYVLIGKSGSYLTRNQERNDIQQEREDKKDAQIQQGSELDEGLKEDVEIKEQPDNENKDIIEDKDDVQQEEKAMAPIEKYKDLKVKAIYYTGPTAGESKRIDDLIALVKTTELNAVVIDIKEGGIVNYESNVPLVKENNLYRKFYNVDEVLEKLHENGVYVIGRIVCFRDDGLARKRADLAIKKPDGTLWIEGNMGAWTNPYNEEVWEYNIDIAKEAVEKGFDEIQFDYVRFPTTGKNSVVYGENMPSKAEAINGFLGVAKKELRDEKGVFVTADVFGIIIESKIDGDAIGQDFEKVGLDIDCICPMIYPSHYANDSNGIMGNGHGQSLNGVLFTKPDLKPYEVVYNTLLKAKDRISGMEGYYANVRPYLQDFTASYLLEGYYQKYGTEQVKQQIQAVYDAGYEEWILWDGGNNYSVGAFKKNVSQ